MNSTLQGWLGGQFDELKAQHLYKSPRILESAAGGTVRMDGREVVNLSSNNYLGLANHPKMREAMKAAVDKWGVGAGAVRWIGGTMSVHDELELRLAEFKHVEAVLVFYERVCGQALYSPALSESARASGSLLPKPS